MKKLVIFSLFVAFTLANCLSINAQTRQKVDVKGQVFASSDFEAGKVTVPFAIVVLPESNVSVSSDADGVFNLPNMVLGTYKIQIQSLGYETLETTITVSETKSNFEFTLSESNFRMDEIVVTAQSSKSGAATASHISKAAMEHMQTNSLADVMALMPGGSMQKADLQGVSTASIRGGSSLGTAVIMDGSPISNNANLQLLSTATGKKAISHPSKDISTSPTSGVDLRTITTDNVESIEIIRGVAPVEYGDITAGAIIVNSKAGYQPLTVKLSVNPNVYSASATQGFALGEKAGNINYGLDYAYSVTNPRESYDYYQRVTARVGYTNTFGKFYTNSSLSLLWTKDLGEPNPDDEEDITVFRQRDLGFRFAHNGTYNANAGFFKSLQYNVTFGYTNRESYYEDEAMNAASAYSYSKVDGSVLSSYKGGHIYDNNGVELTHFGKDMENSRAWLTPSIYDYNYNIYGKELNTYAKVKANFAGNWGKTNHRMVLGVDFKSDGNVGEGKVFDFDNPPPKGDSGFSTIRERAFKDVPFINQLGAFFQETFTAKIAKRNLDIAAGVRYDHTLDFGGGFSPRVNFSYELLKDGKLSLNAAYGITRKAPTLAYLYPDNAYFDLLNFNNASSSSVADEHKMQLITTRVFDSKNYDLEMARQDKYEIGFSSQIGKMHFSITGYKEKMNNGYSFQSTPKTMKSIDYKQYTAQYTEGQTPVLTEKSNDKVLVSYMTATNNGAYERTGLEFIFNFGRIDAIRTSFQLDGELYTHKSWNNGYMFYNRVTVTDYAKYPDMGVFSAKDAGGVDYIENFSTNLIVTHNIPQIGLVLTATAHVDWRLKAWTEYAADDTTPIYYISREDGQMRKFDPAWRNPEHEMYATMKYLLRDDTVDPLRREPGDVYNPAMVINLNVTKQFKNFDVAFFAQNMFRSHPLEYRSHYPGQYYRQNKNTFFFGLQLNARIK